MYNIIILEGELNYNNDDNHAINYDKEATKQIEEAYINKGPYYGVSHRANKFIIEFNGINIIEINTNTRNIKKVKRTTL